MVCDVVIEDPRWSALDLEALAERAASAVLDDLGYDPQSHEISLLGCDDARIATLNAEFRDKPAPTNVLSWPSAERGPSEPGGAPQPLAEGPFDAELGDIAIAYETCAAEATAAQKPITDHVTHLIVHGVLHLMGYDHMTESDAKVMEQIEIRVLEKLGVADPYILSDDESA